MNRIGLQIALLVCVALVVLPLWAAWKGYGEAGAQKRTDASGNVRYVGTRSWVGGGPSRGK